MEDIPELPNGALSSVAKRSFLKEMTSSFGRKSDEKEDGLFMYFIL
jgi:hypothetical protein